MVECYVDSDYAKDLDERRLITGYLFIVCGCIVSWKSVLQNIVVLSTTKAEYVAIVETTKEALWLKDLVSELRMNQRSVMVFCDSQSAISLTKNQGFHEKAKHIDVRFHFTGIIME